MKRYKLEKYKDGEKHLFKATVDRFGSYPDKESGKYVQTILFSDIYGEDKKRCADHSWIEIDKKIQNANLMVGETYTFMARVGIYKRGRTASDFHLKNLCQFKAVA